MIEAYQPGGGHQHVVRCADDFVEIGKTEPLRLVEIFRGPAEVCGLHLLWSGYFGLFPQLG